MYSAYVMSATKHQFDSFSQYGHVEMLSTESEVMRLTSGDLLTCNYKCERISSYRSISLFRCISYFF